MKIYGVYKQFHTRCEETNSLQFDCFYLKKEDAIDKIEKQFVDTLNDVIHECKVLDGWGYSLVAIPYEEKNGYAYINYNKNKEWKWSLTKLEVKE